MDHVAIMNKKWKLLPKILSGEKKIESRWYVSRFAPWNRIVKGDVVYFKDAGCLVTLKAKVGKVLQFENCNSEEIISKYGKDIAFVDPKKAFDWVKGKKYCILIFLENVSEVEPFDIDKTGFGNACAWLCVGDIARVKL
tara:strand:+ start:4881 stop:5297 length:417 start_codon:yes stop_codon:yes gene_type:complete